MIYNKTKKHNLEEICRHLEYKNLTYPFLNHLKYTINLEKFKRTKNQ